jgi:hypothetical protein
LPVETSTSLLTEAKACARPEVLVELVLREVVLLMKGARAKTLPMVVTSFIWIWVEAERLAQSPRAAMRAALGLMPEPGLPPMATR